MKKTMSYIAFFVVMVLLISAYSQRVVKSEKGYTAPEIEALDNDSAHISLNSLRGKYVLVNFWDSNNAVSRIAAGEYDRFSKDLNDNSFRLFSVNTDENKKLFREIVKKDNLDESTQFHIDEAKAKNLRADYRLEQGFSSYLVDPQGKIVAVNPSVKTLESYLAQK